MNTLRKQLVKEIISDGEFIKSGDIGSYLRGYVQRYITRDVRARNGIRTRL